jgi:hypothetical protein
LNIAGEILADPAHNQPDWLSKCIALAVQDAEFGITFQ